MDILGQLLQGAMGGQGNAGAAPQVDVGALASQFGLSPEQANAAVGALLPAVLGGIKNAETGGVLGNVADIANATAAPTDVGAGNAILGQIFGSKDVSRSVASAASQQTGISDTILKAMLPVVAGLVAAQVSKKMGGGIMGGIAGSVLASMIGGGASPAAAAPAAATPAGGILGNLGGLASMLDADHDGNPLDDILGMVRGGNQPA